MIFNGSRINWKILVVGHPRTIYAILQKNMASIFVKTFLCFHLFLIEQSTPPFDSHVFDGSKEKCTILEESYSRIICVPIIFKLGQ